MPLADYKMNYTYNSNNKVSTFQRELKSPGIIQKSHFSYTYDGSNRLDKNDITDSIYVESQSAWYTTPGKETYSYDGNGLLTEKLREMASTGQTTLENEKKWIHSYDANKRCTLIVEHSWDDSKNQWEASDRHSYAYNTSGQMTLAGYEFWNGTAWEKADDEFIYTYNGGRLSKVEEVSQKNDDDDATEYVYDSKRIVDHFITSHRVNGTSTWTINRKTQIFYDSKGEADYGLVYKWNGSAYEAKAFQRILFQPQGVPSVPKAPSGLTITPLKKAGAKLYLTWTDNADDELGFIIYRSTDSSVFDSIGTVAENIEEFTDSNLLNKAKYYYRVAAYNATGVSEYSNTLGQTTLATRLSQTDLLEITVFPNPTQGQLTLKGISEGSISVYDLAGHLIYHDSNIETHPLMLNISLADNGIYIARVKSQQNESVFRIVKQ